MSLNPVLLQVHVRDWLRRLSLQEGRPVSLATVPDSELSRFSELGLQWLYLLGIWQTGPAGKDISVHNENWLPGYRAALSDFKSEDVVGSPFAVQKYVVHQDFGGDAELAHLRARLRKHQIRIMLDFVPNHLALDHEWIQSYPDRFVQGDVTSLSREPHNYFREEERVFAHGRDPYFPGWADTAQLDYSNPETVSAMALELVRISEQCDGLRCDMAMLILPDVFRSTWGRAGLEFWHMAIGDLRRHCSEFVFCAEVYWGLEWRLQQVGFDYTYDKTLYDRLLARDPAAISSHLRAGLDFQRKLVRFLENHDEPRAAIEFPGPIGQAAAVIAYTIPGLRFFHDGQLEGARRKPSIHLARREDETADPGLRDFYLKLFGALGSGLAQGEWRRLEPVSAWEGNLSSDAVIAYAWYRMGCVSELIVVNYSDHASQAYVQLPEPQFAGRTVLLSDALQSIHYERSGDSLIGKGLYVDLPPWFVHLFRVQTLLTHSSLTH